MRPILLAHDLGRDADDLGPPPRFWHSDLPAAAWWPPCTCPSPGTCTGRCCSGPHRIARRSGHETSWSCFLSWLCLSMLVLGFWKESTPKLQEALHSTPVLSSIPAVVVCITALMAWRLVLT